MKAFKVIVGGYTNPVEFVQIWSPKYQYPNYEKYLTALPDALEHELAFQALFEWKNGTGDKISRKKSKVIEGYYGAVPLLKELRHSQDFDWDRFEKELSPYTKGTIWKIFLLHFIDPERFPIFDQHVYRSFCFFTQGVIEELPKQPEKIYTLYKEQYLKWVLDIKNNHSIKLSELDRALFAFGKILKILAKLPIEIPTQPKQSSL